MNNSVKDSVTLPVKDVQCVRKESLSADTQSVKGRKISVIRRVISNHSTPNTTCFLKSGLTMDLQRLKCLILSQLRVQHELEVEMIRKKQVLQEREIQLAALILGYHCQVRLQEGESPPQEEFLHPKLWKMITSLRGLVKAKAVELVARNQTLEGNLLGFPVPLVEQEERINRSGPLLLIDKEGGAPELKLQPCQISGLRYKT